MEVKKILPKPREGGAVAGSYALTMNGQWTVLREADEIRSGYVVKDNVTGKEVSTMAHTQQ